MYLTESMRLLTYSDLLASAVSAKVAYYPPGYIKSLWHGHWIPCVTRPSTYPLYVSSRLDTQVYVWRTGTTLHLVWRGTSSVQDVLEDLDVRVKRWGDTQVHSGILNQFTSVESDVTSALESMSAETNTLQITGHSLGGALAQLSSAHYGRMFPDLKVICHSFGSPRVGDKRFVSELSLRVCENIRVVNKEDPIPMVPQRPIWLHAPRCIVLDDRGGAVEQREDTPWQKRLQKTLTTVDYQDVRRPHFIETYVERLRSLLQYPINSLQIMPQQFAEKA